jgi:hypothetical protein
MSFTVCFDNLGGGSAPNIMATVSIPGIKAQLAGGPPKSMPGQAVGTVTIYSNMADDNCAANTTGTATGAPLPVNLYKVASKGGVAAPACPASPLVGRPASCGDYDGDGCIDEVELDGSVKTCGRDPYNPNDSSIANISGSYSVLATVAGGPSCPGEPATDQCPWDGTGNPGPGITFHCIAVVKDAGGALPRPVTQDLYCYIDSPTSDINVEAYGTDCEGDGFPGASPPGPVRANFETGPPVLDPGCSEIGGVVWGDVSTIKHTQLTGTLTAKKLSVSGCFEDDDAQSSLGNVYVSSTQNPYGGKGTVSIYVLQPAACAGSPTVVPPGALLPLATLESARQSTSAAFSGRDSDGDGCSDAEEIQKGGAGTQAFGGLRDPYNRWDFFDVDGDTNIGLFGDIFTVAFDFGTAGSDATDRAAPIPGGNLWNLPGPDGLVNLFDDIFGVAFQFGHDCTA